MIWKGCGKNEIGSKRPEKRSRTKNLARNRPRIDVRRMARVPTAKLMAATIKKLRTTLTKNARKEAQPVGRFKGYTASRITAVGAVSRASLNTDSPNACATYI